MPKAPERYNHIRLPKGKEVPFSMVVLFLIGVAVYFHCF